MTGLCPRVGHSARNCLPGVPFPNRRRVGARREIQAQCVAQKWTI